MSQMHGTGVSAQTSQSSRDQVVDLSAAGGPHDWGITIGKTGESFIAHAPDKAHTQEALIVGKTVDQNLPVNWGINSIEVNDLTPEGKPDRVEIRIGNLENPSLTRTIAVQLKDGWQEALKKEIKDLKLE